MARSRREFVAKISIVVEECDEAAFWLEFGTDLDFFKELAIQDVRNESNELTAIFVASRCTARRRLAEARVLGLAQNHSQNPGVPESHIPSR
jgi:hypothetical protein